MEIGPDGNETKSLHVSTIDDSLFIGCRVRCCAGFFKCAWADRTRSEERHFRGAKKAPAESPIPQESAEPAARTKEDAEANADEGKETGSETRDTQVSSAGIQDR